MNSLKQLSTAIPRLFLVVVLFSGCSRSGSEARTTTATTSIKGQVLGLSQLVDAGNTTLEAAFESGWWASARGDYAADVASWIPAMQAQEKQWNGDKAQYAAQMKTKFARFKSLQIKARKTVADDQVELKYQFEFENQNPNQPAVHVNKLVSMVKVGGAWKCAKTLAYNPDWDAGSQPEPNL